MARAEQVNAIHEGLNDVLAALHRIPVCDETGREARQEAFVSLVWVRKTLEEMGLWHTMPAKKAEGA